MGDRIFTPNKLDLTFQARTIVQNVMKIK